MTTTERNIITSPYRRGADFGFIFGIYLTLMFFIPILAPASPVSGLVSMLMIAGVPFVTFYFINRYDRELQRCATFPMMWMLGVMMFVCGIIISGALLVIYMKWVEPDFIFKRISALAELGEQAPKGSFLEETGKIADEMIELRFIPSAMSFVLNIIFGAIVSGSLLSIFISGLLALSHKLQRHGSSAGNNR